MHDESALFGCVLFAMHSRLSTPAFFHQAPVFSRKAMTSTGLAASVSAANGHHYTAQLPLPNDSFWYWQCAGSWLMGMAGDIGQWN